MWWFVLVIIRMCFFWNMWWFVVCRNWCRRWLMKLNRVLMVWSWKLGLLWRLVLVKERLCCWKRRYLLLLCWCIIRLDVWFLCICCLVWWGWSNWCCYKFMGLIFCVLLLVIVIWKIILIIFWRWLILVCMCSLILLVRIVIIWMKSVLWCFMCYVIVGCWIVLCCWWILCVVFI